MGKNKQNRTKNNARPSSSARSAELLGNEATTFFGLGTIKDGTISMAPGVVVAPAEVDANVDANFQLALKKMVKKDATTKLKALQEFSELCNKSDIAAVKAILPFWPRLYGPLCGDTEHRVREAAHLAHKAVIAKVKKYIAPYLKEIIGPWYCSQYDTYPPAASAAVASFNEAFSLQKMAEVVAFCQCEILGYFHQNIAVHTPQTLSNPKVYSQEEMEDKYRRVVSSSLLGYASYLQKVPPDRLKAAEEGNRAIVGSTKYWKLGQSKDPVIRHGFLSSLIALCQHGQWLLMETPSLASAIFSCLSEEDPLVLPLVWEAVLHAVVAVPECWNHSNVEKQLFPKLFQILRSGGKGHASNIFPKILPLLSEIPSNKINDKSAFMEKLFSNMRSGLLEPSVNRSQSESRMVATSFVETLQYMVMLHSEDHSLVELLVKGQLFGAINDAWQSTSNKLQTNVSLYYQIALMVRSWYKNTLKYDETIKLYWSCMNVLYRENLNENTLEECREMLMNQTNFLCTLQSPQKFQHKYKERVRFTTSDDKVASTPTPTLNSNPAVLSVPGFDDALLSFTQKISVYNIQQFSMSNNTLYLQFLLDLSKYFNSHSLFNAAISESNLLELIKTSLESGTVQETVVQLGLQLLPHLSEQAQENIIEKLSDREDTDVVLLCRGLLACTSSCMINWKKGEKFSAIYLNLVSSFIGGSTEALADDALLGFLLPSPSISQSTYEEVIERILQTISEESTSVKNVNAILDACGRNICVTTVFRKLAIHLFCLSCGPEGERFVLPLRTILMKLKIFAIINHSWIELARDITKELLTSPYEITQVVTTVTKFVEISLDVDLTEACDSEEIIETVPLIRALIEPSPEIWSCALSLKQMALEALEMFAENSLQYFELKTISSESHRKTSNTVPIDDKVEIYVDDPEFVLAYRSHHLDARTTVPSQAIKPSTITEYLKWLELNNELLNLLLTAYPISAKFEDMRIPGRYIVDSHFKIIPETIENDVISWDISKEEWEQLDEDWKIRSCFPEDSFTDENLVAPLGNCFLDLVECASVLQVVLKLLPEIEVQPHISLNFGSFREKIQWTLATGTPKEMDFIYKLARTLVSSNASWCALMPTLKPLFHRRFNGCCPKPNLTKVESSVAELLASPDQLDNPDHVLKLVAVVKSHAHCLKLDEWNTIFIQLERVLKKLELFATDLENDSLMRAAAVSSFFLVTQDCFLNCLSRKEDERLAPELIQMWNDVVEKELWTHLFTLWRSLLPNWLPQHPQTITSLTHQKVKPIECPVAVRRLCSAVISVARLRPAEDIASTVALARQLSLLIFSSHLPLQITAFKMLLSLVPELVQADTLTFQSSVADTPDDEDKGLFTRTRDCDWSVKCLSHALAMSHTVVDALLSDFKPGDTCTVQPYSDAFVYAHGYLLLCSIILEMCGEAHVALRFQYGAWLKNGNQLHSLLKALFNFMPAYVVHGEIRDTTQLFESYGSIDLDQGACSSRVEQRACYLYRLCLQWLPAAVREWYAETDHSVASLVARTTTTHVSPILIASELKAVQNASLTQIDNISVAVSTVSREVIGTYVIDDASMQILISLPSNYPLGTIKVDFKAASVIPRAWRISMFLVHRNGSLTDALALWKSDLDKKFEGVDECEICFSILHGPNLDIPKQSCTTCRKKFHSACLYKWFNTSNKSSCPHCRNQF